MSTLSAATASRNESTITIEVRRLADGTYRGESASDRWNLQTLAFHCSDLTRANLDLAKARTRSQLANIRRALAKLGFALAILTDTARAVAKPSRRPSRPSGRAVALPVIVNPYEAS